MHTQGANTYVHEKCSLKKKVHYLGILGPRRPLGIQGEIDSFNAKFPSVIEPVSHFPSPLTPQPHWGMFLDISALRMDPPTSCGPDCSPPLHQLYIHLQLQALGLVLLSQFPLVNRLCFATVRDSAPLPSCSRRGHWSPHRW